MEVEWSASCPSHFTPRERDPGSHWIGGWGGPQSWSGHVVEEKNSQPLLGVKTQSSDCPAHCQSLY